MQKEESGQASKQKKSGKSRGEHDVTKAQTTRGSLETGDELFASMDAWANEDEEQKALIRTAFVGGIQEDDFEEEIKSKQEKKEEEEHKKTAALPGWGGWTGEGIIPRPRKDGPRMTPSQKRPEGEPAKKRPHVQIYEGPDRKAAKYTSAQAPFPFTKEQLERQMRMPTGLEWNAIPVYKRRIQPRVLVRVGQTVKPIQYTKSLPSEQKDALIEAWSTKKKPNKGKPKF